jgi:hypothetical protein
MISKSFNLMKKLFKELTMNHVWQYEQELLWQYNFFTNQTPLCGRRQCRDGIKFLPTKLLFVEGDNARMASVQRLHVHNCKVGDSRRRVTLIDEFVHVLKTSIELIETHFVCHAD